MCYTKYDSNNKTTLKQDKYYTNKPKEANESELPSKTSEAKV